ncbi:MAG: hypothetical protein ABI743_05250 [bacterium]
MEAQLVEIWFWVIVIALVVFSVWGANWAKQVAADQSASVGMAVQRATGSYPSQRHISSNAALAIEERGKSIIFLRSSDGKNWTTRVIPYGDLISVEVIEDGHTVKHHRTSRAAQAGGVLVGGLLLGPVGAVVGGLTAGKRTVDEQKVRKVILRITVADTSSPIFELPFLEWESSAKSAEYIAARGKADHWYGVLHAATREAERAV